MSSFALSNVYNNYLTTYGAGQQRSGRFDSHKKTELREIYNSIVKQSEDAPLYFLDTSGESQQYAVNLKEDARDLQKAISSLTSDYSSSILDQKIASSDNEDAVEVRFGGQIAQHWDNFGHYRAEHNGYTAVIAVPVLVCKNAQTIRAIIVKKISVPVGIERLPMFICKKFASTLS